eukprot:685527-Amorphochlora_amoeboformis.AAC.1
MSRPCPRCTYLSEYFVPFRHAAPAMLSEAASGMFHRIRGWKEGSKGKVQWRHAASDTLEAERRRGARVCGRDGAGDRMSDPLECNKRAKK